MQQAKSHEFAKFRHRKLMSIPKRPSFTLCKFGRLDPYKKLIKSKISGLRLHSFSFLCGANCYAESVTAVSPLQRAADRDTPHNVLARNSLQHCHQLIGGSESSALQPGWSTACQRFQFFRWISTEIHLGTLHAGMSQPE